MCPTNIISGVQQIFTTAVYPRNFLYEKGSLLKYSMVAMVTPVKRRVIKSSRSGDCMDNFVSVWSSWVSAFFEITDFGRIYLPSKNQKDSAIMAVVNARGTRAYGLINVVVADKNANPSTTGSPINKKVTKITPIRE